MFLRGFQAPEKISIHPFQTIRRPSWVDVSHRSPQSAVTWMQGNYAPVCQSILYGHVPGMTESQADLHSQLGGFESYWGISQMEVASRREEQLCINLTGSVDSMRADLRRFSGTYGQGWEEARMVTWEETLEIGGLVEKFQDNRRECYDIVPFVYTARAVTGAGLVYEYTELDYYVPWIGDCVLDVEEAGSSLPGDLPHPE
jgi:hypothetical protein